MSDPEEKPIRVVDRRMFTREGELRADYQAEEAPEANAPAVPPPAESPSEALAPPPAGAADHGPAGAEGRPPEGADGASGEFLFLVQFLYTNALAGLGVDPMTGAPLPRQDLPFARKLIEALAVLESKTRGNLSFEETNLLSQVLYQLRMDYVEATRPAGGPGPGTGRR